MANGIYSAVSGAVAQSRVLETVAHNLANVSTTGYKAGRINFAEVLARASAGRRAETSFVTPAEVRMDLRPGALRPTESKLDVALEGPGYLTLKDGGRIVHSRGGTLRIRADGLLADGDGRPLLGVNDRELKVGATASALHIERDGTVSNEEGKVGVLKVVEFARPAALSRLGANLVVAPAIAGARPARSTTVRQGHLEGANVGAVTEISAMIVATRAFEALTKVISTYREIDGRAVNDLGQER